MLKARHLASLVASTLFAGSSWASISGLSVTNTLQSQGWVIQNYYSFSEIDNLVYSQSTSYSGFGSYSTPNYVSSGFSYGDYLQNYAYETTSVITNTSTELTISGTAGGYSATSKTIGADEVHTNGYVAVGVYFTVDTACTVHVTASNFTEGRIFGTETFSQWFPNFGWNSVDGLYEPYNEDATYTVGPGSYSLGFGSTTSARTPYNAPGEHDYSYNNGTFTFDIQSAAAPVPEPASLGLPAIGVLAFRRRRLR